MRLVPHSARGRVVTGVTSIIVVTFAVVAVATTLSLRHFLLDRLDTQLHDAGVRYSVGLEHNDHDADNANPLTGVEGQAFGTLGARILNGTVTVAAVVGHDDAQAGVSPADRQALGHLGPSTGARTIDLPSLGDYRIIVTPGRDGDLLVTGLPMHPLNLTIARLIAIEGVVFVIALACCAVACAALVRRTLRPLAVVADTAAMLAQRPMATGAVDLADRVPTGPTASEVSSVAGSVNTLLDEVEGALIQRQASEERLREFLADASHELRTPVAVVRSHAELAQRVARQDEMSEDVRHALERIVSESGRMGRLVDDLLLLARVDTGLGLRLQPTDLTRTVLDAVADAKVAGADHRWQLDLPEEPVLVMGDASALHQIVTNLLANARVHTPPGTVVTTRLRSFGERAELEVTDTGPGIPMPLRERIFERFVHGTPARGTRTGSSGLGLPIVAALVDAHHGTIDVRAEPGTTVLVRLPAVLDLFVGDQEPAESAH